MEMRLSNRLTAIASLVSPGRRVADIGTDHAHLPIWLVQQGRSPGGVAMDVAAGPLERARAAIEAAGLEERIAVRLSDGFAALEPGEADCAVIAGMGGELMIRLLREGEAVVRSLDELVLSPQSEIPRVRAFLRENGFKLRAEDMVLEEGKYYQMMRVRPAAGRGGEGEIPRSMAEEAGTQLIEDRYGPLLLRMRHPVLRSYLDWERRIREDILQSLALAGGEGARRREAQVRADLALNEAARRRFEGTL